MTHLEGIVVTIVVKTTKGDKRVKLERGEAGYGDESITEFRMRVADTIREIVDGALE